MPSKGYSEEKEKSFFSLLKQNQTKTLNTSFLSCLKRKWNIWTFSEGGGGTGRMKLKMWRKNDENEQLNIHRQDRAKVTEEV